MEDVLGTHNQNHHMWISIKPLKKKMSYKKATQYKKNYIGGGRSFFFFYGKEVYVEVL